MILAFFSILLATIFGAFAALLMKKYSDRLNFRELNNPLLFLKKNIILLLPAVIYVVSTLLFIPWLKEYDVSFLYPFTSMSYIWTVILGKLFLKEKFSLQKNLGIALIIIGITLVYLS